MSVSLVMGVLGGETTTEPGRNGTEPRVTVAVDAMGGDYAPDAIVRGALAAVRLLPHIRLILVGDEARIRASAKGPVETALPSSVQIVHTDECIGMDESPSAIFRRKKNCSLAVAARLVSEGRAQAFFSAGNSGACMAAAIKYLQKIEGIDRPAIATLLPNATGRFLLLDAGANTDCDEGNLLEFALMGSAYASHVMDIPNPRVAIVSIGEEDGKGDALTKSAASILKLLPINFIGNIEGREIYQSKADATRSKADVIVCDGFVGNVILKTSESAAEFVKEIIHREAMRSPISMLGGLLMKSAFRRVKRVIDPDEVGGAPLLGVRGVAMVGHGRSGERAVCNGIHQAVHGVEQNFISEIERLIQQSQTATLSKIETL